MKHDLNVILSMVNQNIPSSKFPKLHRKMFFGVVKSSVFTKCKQKCTVFMNLASVFISLPDFKSENTPSIFKTIIVTFKIASDSKILGKMLTMLQVETRKFFLSWKLDLLIKKACNKHNTIFFISLTAKFVLVSLKNLRCCSC